MAKTGASRKYDDLLLEIEELKSRLSETQETLNEVRKSEEALRLREEKDHMLFENMSEMFQILEPIFDSDSKLIDFRYILINKASEKLIGKKREEIEGKTAKELWGIVEYYWYDLLEKVLRTDSPIHMVNYSKELNTYYDLLAWKANDLQVAIVYTDISELKRSEEAIEYHSHLLDNVSDAIIGTDAELRVTHWNAGAERIYGYKAEEVINRSAREILQPTYIGMSRDQVVDKLKAGSVDTEIIHLTKAGQKVIVDSHTVALYDPKGKFIGSVGVNRDITERKQIEEKLKISEARFRAIQDNSLDRFTILKPFYDDKGNIIDFIYLYQNARAAKATGRSPEELVGCRMTEIFPTFPKTHFFTIYKQSFETNQPAEFEDHYSADGVDDWFYVRVTPIPEGIAIATQIITERKQLQEELKKNNENLEEQVRLRTRELEDQRKNLQKVNEDLLRSNIELDKFASVASHDLQEPLRSITSFAQLLALKYGNTFDNDAREYLDYIVDGGKRMYELINGLLIYSKLSKREINFFSIVDLNKIIDSVKENLIQVIKERNCTIECGQLPCVEADPNQMIRLFQNLISNGIKFSLDSPHIYISCKTEKNRYLISVRDEGIGIESQYYNKIFEIFKRLMPRDEYEGTGIGLTICKKIIENHNGEIWVESEPGKGSTFICSIPKKQPADS
jgi:PAS domain S-box-containing protein